MISCLDYVNEKKSILKERVENFENKPCLAIIQVGDNAASKVYIKNKHKVCEEVGIAVITYWLPENVTEEKLIEAIDYCDKLRADGIIVQLPLPKHIDIKKIQQHIPPNKDVDGFCANSKFDSCTPKGIINWLKYNEVNLKGMGVCIIGRSEIVGKPLVKLLEKEDATLIWCNSKTNNLTKYTKDADIIVSAIGKANYFDKFYFDGEHKHQIVVDVGINRDCDGKLCGDVCENVSEVVKYKTPVPNGVGKLTVCTLIENVVEAYVLNGGV